ncbi:receptor activity-modifying protein 3-like isoform X1 [Heterodontus francisci]|uniref:receptor activity-modifying protein 3-like isoform X1 n=2 Tax=Heterodontus francisci TaxID=7792 RepID=UPI00355AEAC8
MEKDAFILVQLLALAVWGNSLLTSSLSAKNNTNLHNQSQSNQSERKTLTVCNETLMLEAVHWCGYQFESQLNRMNSSDWCNFTLIAGYYNFFSHCTEFSTENVKCYWPNPQVENYVINIHKFFFSNCTSEMLIFQDPPDKILIILISVPIFLTIVMIAMVVWCSKRNDILV